jgi:hypothetical protein
MSRATIIVLALIAAFAAGTSSAGYAITHWLDLAGQRSGPWKRLAATGDEAADPYSRAFEHISGVLPIGSAEGQIYRASDDSDGQKLNASCQYRVEGDIPSARLFTLRAETADGQMIMAKAPLQGALHSDQLLFFKSSFAINIGATAQPDNWLALQTTGPFVLVLTYFDVAVINNDTGNSTRLPRITKGRCADV